MKWYPSILEIIKAVELKTISKGFNFVFEFRIRRTIKRDTSLVGLRKIECSSIQIKSKESHSNTSRALRIFFCDFRCRKSRPKPGVPAPVLLTARCLCSSEVPTFARSSDIDLTLAGSPDISGAGCLFNWARRKSRRTSGVPIVGSPDVCQEFRHWLSPMDFWLVVNSVFCCSRKSRDLRRDFRRRSERLGFHLEYKYSSLHF